MENMILHKEMDHTDTHNKTPEYYWHGVELINISKYTAKNAF